MASSTAAVKSAMNQTKISLQSTWNTGWLTTARFPARALKNVFRMQPKRRKASSDRRSRRSVCSDRNERKTAHGISPSMALTMPLTTSDGISALAPHGVTIVPKMIPMAAHGPNVMQERTAMAVAGKRIETPFSTSKLNASLLQMANSTNVMAICPRRVSAARSVGFIGVVKLYDGGGAILLTNGGVLVM